MDSVKKWEYDVTHCGVSKHKHHFSLKYVSFNVYIGLVFIRNKSDKIKKASQNHMVDSNIGSLDVVHNITIIVMQKQSQMLKLHITVVHELKLQILGQLFCVW